MDDAIRVEGLTKQFGSFTAVDDVSFHVKSGEIFGILGPNGAGKTTTLEIIEGLQKASSGHISVLGVDIDQDPKAYKARIGVQLQSSAYYDYLNLEEILDLLGSCYPTNLPATELLKQVGLSEESHKKVKQLSGGQQQRFTVAASLVNSPDLVILDEPTTGLDPQSRHNVWDLINEMQNNGVTVVLTTHYMEEAESLCTRLAIMDRGKLIAVDTPQNMISRLDNTYTLKLELTDPPNEDQILSLTESSTSIEQIAPTTYLLKVDKSPTSLDHILQTIVTTEMHLKHLEMNPVTLEDVFLSLTGNELRD